MDTPLFIAARFIIKHRPRADRLPNASRRGMYLLPAHDSLFLSLLLWSEIFAASPRPPICEIISDRIVTLILKIRSIFPTSSWDSLKSNKINVRVYIEKLLKN